ncbi:MAG TPA: class I SAM-dependent methyltransferase [Chitinophagaceae bacterium]
MVQPCIICGNSTGNTGYTIEELQLGTHEPFPYQLCGNCGTMQLLQVPADLGRYYPNEDYYSFNMELDVKSKQSTTDRIKTEYLLFGKHRLIGKLLSLGYKNETYDWARFTAARYDDAILDIGTGNGSLLSKLHKMGYRNLTGIDPFINESRDYGNVRVLKQNIFGVEQQYDVVMMHHALEHMTDPHAAVRKMYEILKPGGRALIRVPIMGNYGWQTYGTWWCGLDAPRHIFIPSEKGLKMLVTEAGFEVSRFYYDSYDYVIWCSEQYKRGIPLNAPNSQMVNPGKGIFTKKQLKEYRRIMTRENQKGNGDMAAIYLVKPKN